MDSEIQDLIITCSTPVPRETQEEFLDRCSDLFPVREAYDKLKGPGVDAYRWEPDEVQQIRRSIRDACEQHDRYHETFPTETIEEICLVTRDGPRYPYLLVVLDVVLDPEAVRDMDDPDKTVSRARFGLQVFLHALSGRDPETAYWIPVECPSVTYAVCTVSEDVLSRIRTLVEDWSERDEGIRLAPTDETRPSDQITDLLPLNLSKQGQGIPESVLRSPNSNKLTVLGDGAGVLHGDVRNPTIQVLITDDWSPHLYPLSLYPPLDPLELEQGNFRWMSPLLAAGAWMDPATDMVGNLEKRISREIDVVSVNVWNFLRLTWYYRILSAVLELTSMINHVSFLQRKFGDMLDAWASGDGSEAQEVALGYSAGFSTGDGRRGYLAHFARRFRTDLENVSVELQEMHHGARLAIDYVSTAVLVVFTGILVFLAVFQVLPSIVRWVINWVGI